MCGEHYPVPKWGILSVGSSPRVRGTLADICSWCPTRRFIPACAGNITGLRFFGPQCAVHPRVCGEHPTIGYGTLLPIGSSPRVRGTFFHAGEECVAARFIPACAGNIAAGPSKSPHTSVHPRVCGEHSLFPPATPTEHGSSPRVRGTSLLRRDPRIPQRFIPACAGNMRSSVGCLTASSVHPRVCGEHLAARILFEDASGSSPRVRGTLSSREGQRDCLRFIPACAGNIQNRSSAFMLSPVHPRVCGEHTIDNSHDAGPDGSSPRVRGT